MKVLIDTEARKENLHRAWLWRKKNPRNVLFNYAKKRAKKFGLVFDIKLEDIVVPEFCPILGIKLEPGTGVQKDCNPSLDRIDNTKGYTKDNICVISLKANRLKNSASLDEIIKIKNYLENHLCASVST